MDYPFSPPQPPLPPVLPKKEITYGKKCVLLGLQCFLLMIATLIVYSLVYSREETNKEVAGKITTDWGGPFYFGGIIGVSESASRVSVAPALFNCEAIVNSQSLHRGVYEAEVYDAVINVSGQFDRDKLQKRLGDNLVLLLNANETQIDRLNPVTVCGKSYNWDLVSDSLIVKLDISSLPSKIDFSTSFKVRGSEGLYVAQAGGINKITFNGKASNPSFQGDLPSSRRVSHDEFNASWESRGPSENYSQNMEYPATQEEPSGYSEDDHSSDSRTDEVLDNRIFVEDDEPADYDIYYSNYVGADFLVGVDRYQKVARSLKYSFIIILLTYIAVLAVEMIRKRRIPLLNYFLIGVALVIFYSLLLSFTELVVFGLAYLIAAVMTVSLISFYMGMSLNSKKIGWIIAIILTVYYGACFAMLSSTYALLLGSLLLFAATALLMYATLKIRGPINGIPGE